MLEQALHDHLPSRKQQFLQGNLDVLHAGLRAATPETMTV
jgi:hypothetical protein